MARPESSRFNLTIEPASALAKLGVERAQVRRWIAASLRRPGCIALQFVDRRQARALNREFRGRDYATNVLTFNYHSAHNDEVPVHCDIAICVPVLRSEASKQGKSLTDHLAHLIIHSVLHAQGWDHESEPEALEMEAQEVALLRRFRIADPYGDLERPNTGPGK